jgi:hypothetical protein
MYYGVPSNMSIQPWRDTHAAPPLMRKLLE